MRDEVRAPAEQIVYLTESLHPRFEEVCETLPARLGARLHRAAGRVNGSRRCFARAGISRPAHVGGFLLLHFVAGLRRWRRGTLRYRLRSRNGIGGVAGAHQGAGCGEADGYHAAVELAECQRLVKGYSEVRMNADCRTTPSYRRLLDVWLIGQISPQSSSACAPRRLADEEGEPLSSGIELGPNHEIPIDTDRRRPGIHTAGRRCGERLIIDHVTVIEGTGRAPQPDMTVIIVARRLRPSLRVSLRAASLSRRIDARGNTSFPGCSTSTSICVGPRSLRSQRNARRSRSELAALAS